MCGRAGYAVDVHQGNTFGVTTALRGNRSARSQGLVKARKPGSLGEGDCNDDIAR